MDVYAFNTRAIGGCELRFGGHFNEGSLLKWLICFEWLLSFWQAGALYSACISRAPLKCRH
jgi:hypothetical protein